MILMTAIKTVLQDMSWIREPMYFPFGKNAHETADIPNAQISLKLAENIQYPTDEITGAVVSNKMTGKDAVDGVGIDGSDSGQKISYMSRSILIRTFPKEPVKTQENFSEKAAELNLYTQEKADEFGQSFLRTK